MKETVVPEMKREPLHSILGYEWDSKSRNIGDYIQSIAANQFMKSTQYVNRETLKQYSGNVTKIIMNGWFMHSPENFPPSSNINPLFISFHITPPAVDTILGSQENIEYLKNHSPIGCRDMATLNYLTEKGIDAYFSGCLTLTLGQTYPIVENRGGEIYIVEPSVDVKKTFFNKLIVPSSVSILKNIKKIKLISSNVKKNYRKHYFKTPLHRILYCSALYISYSKIFEDDILLTAEYLSHDIEIDKYPNEESRFYYADELIKKYSQASLVITSRIHCALPCLGVGTPAIFIYNEKLDQGRYDGLRSLFNCIEYRSPYHLVSKIKCHGKISKNSIIKNKDDYKVLCKHLIDTCRQFAEK